MNGIPPNKDLSIRRTLEVHFNKLRRAIDKKEYGRVKYYIDELLSKLDDYIDEVIEEFVPRGQRAKVKYAIEEKIRAIKGAIIDILDELTSTLMAHRGEIPERRERKLEYLIEEAYDLLKRIFDTIQNVHKILATRGLKGLREQGYI